MKKAELIVAMDVPSTEAAKAVLKQLPDTVKYYKVGLELFTAEGPEIVTYLRKRRKKVFLDLKLHDIPRTVARSVTAASQHGASMMTVHAGGGADMLKAAAEAADDFGKGAPKLVAVTALTSLNNQDMMLLGLTRSVTEHTFSLGQLAISSGMDGLVCSPHEAGAFRTKLGPDPILVTPGIRPAGAGADDQKRAAAPDKAVKAGANYLVVGRPILEAPDPGAAATAILAQMEM